MHFRLALLELHMRAPSWEYKGFLSVECILRVSSRNFLTNSQSVTMGASDATYHLKKCGKRRQNVGGTGGRWWPFLLITFKTLSSYSNLLVFNEFFSNGAMDMPWRRLRSDRPWFQYIEKRYFSEGIVNSRLLETQSTRSRLLTTKNWANGINLAHRYVIVYCWLTEKKKRIRTVTESLNQFKNLTI